MEVDNSPGQNCVRNHGGKGIFGDPFLRHKQKAVRILLQNVGGIGFVSGERNKETLKMEKLKMAVCNFSVDLLCLTEVNKDWRKVNTKHTVWEGTKSWKENRRVQASYNVTQQPDTVNQVGGTVTCAFDELVFGICNQGSDNRKLGRWSYIIIEGKNSLKTAFITCYCPVKGSNPGSAYTQQLVYMNLNRHLIPDGITCPRQLFGHDLQSLIS